MNHQPNHPISADNGDTDAIETQEWRDALLALTATHGPERARFVLDELARREGLSGIAEKASRTE